MSPFPMTPVRLSGLGTENRDWKTERYRESGNTSIVYERELREDARAWNRKRIEREAAAWRRRVYPKGSPMSIFDDKRSFKIMRLLIATTQLVSKYQP